MYEPLLLDTLNWSSLCCPYKLNQFTSSTWVLFNESWGQFDSLRLDEALKKLGPSRLISEGCSAVVYTQLTDIEVEANGLYTYDRSVLKFSAAQLREVNEKLKSPPPGE